MLYIRTQDRMALVPLKGVIFIGSTFPQDYKDTIHKTNDQELKKKLMHDDSKRVWLVRIEINDNEDTLGTYTSKERAIEVLDEIQEAINDNENTWYHESNNGYGPVKSVYQMPKE